MTKKKKKMTSPKPKRRPTGGFLLKAVSMGPGHRSPTQYVKPPVSHPAVTATIKRGARRFATRRSGSFF
jgi:hypothetical protein